MTTDREFKLSTPPVSVEDAVEFAAELERAVGEVAHGTRKVSRIPLEPIARLVQFVRDTAATPQAALPAEPVAWYSAQVDDCITHAKKVWREKERPWDAVHYKQPLYADQQLVGPVAYLIEFDGNNELSFAPSDEAGIECTPLYAPQPAAAPVEPVAMPPYWSVTVDADGDRILSIGYDSISSDRPLEEPDERTILGAAQHLLAFIGYGLPPCRFDPDEDAAAPAVLRGGVEEAARAVVSHLDYESTSDPSLAVAIRELRAALSGQQSAAADPEADRG